MARFRNTEINIILDSDEAFKTGQAKRVQLAEDGTPFPAPPVDLEQAHLSTLFDGFNSTLLRENAAIKTTNENLVATHASTVQALQQSLNEQATANTQNTNTLQSQHATAVQALRSQLSIAQAEAAANAEAAEQANALKTENDQLKIRNASLEAIAPFNPRAITVPAFLNRLTQGSLMMLFTDPDPVVQSIAAMLKDWSANDWPILFDSEQFQQAMGYLIQSGKLSPERVAAITVDSSREEAPIV